MASYPHRNPNEALQVPTILVYPKNSTIPSSWGFLSEKPAEQMNEDKDCKEWFKTFLDETKLQQAQRHATTQGITPASIQEVEQLYCDFFKFLYQTIQQNLQGELANRWEDATIEFIFSVPTTWKPVPTVERFRSTIERAGFGRHPNHTASIGLTEAEAAADLCVLRVSNTGGKGSLSLEQMDVVQGATIGSVQLDTAFEMSARERLEIADRTIPLRFQAKELDDLAWEMAKSKEWQNAKCEYGSWDDETPFFTVAIPKFDRTYVNDIAGINHGEMKFRRDEIRGYFDVQIKKLFDLIDKQLARLQNKFPSEQLAHLVLSGGLGNSAYVQRFASRLNHNWSRASYGTLCKVLYDPKNPQHFGQKKRMDPMDGKLYVTDWINWFIKQGEPVSIDQPKVRQFSRKCPPATRSSPDPPRIFPTAVVTSDLEKDMLPLVMNSSCRTLCEISSDFSYLPLSTFKLKNRHWWSAGEKYHRIEYVVKVAIGPADISFELWHGGQKISKDHPIKVEWHAADPPPETPPKQWESVPVAWQPNPHPGLPTQGSRYAANAWNGFDEFLK
ncbi:hypothetical protein G7Y89_g8382 [Cudoniella acicularis]|uniref:Uncharacterized protein n=1 Tax=Cudoniella acicularis TaxID=354080 RepID=A0A8H4RGQ3_9HELO|nr:hypothetical protein G7Y89_g8382 [Cudoniella acicularis]